MGLESATFVSQLDASNPVGSDLRSTADDHLRLIKSALTGTFPDLRSEMSASASELNQLKGINTGQTIQAQINAKADLSGTANVWTGAQTFDATCTFSAATTFNATATFKSKVDFSATVSLAVRNVIAGQHTIWVPAGAMTATSANGATATDYFTGTNDNVVQSMDFDPSTQQYAQFGIQMPKSWDESTLIAQFIWTCATAAGNAVLSLSAGAFADNDALDTALGTAVNVTDGIGSAYDSMVSPETAAVTVAGSPAAEEYVLFEVSREAGTATDTVTTDVKVLGVKIHYNVNIDTDD